MFWRVAFISILTLALGYWAYDQLRSVTLVLDSEPSGAMVFVDGRRIGITPLRRQIPGGGHLIELEHSYYLRTSARLDARPGETVKRHVALELGEGILYLLSNPKGAWVEVDGRRLSSATPTELPVVAGEHVVRMGLPERHAVEAPVVVLSGGRKEINLELDMDPHGSLIVLADPADARVRFPDLDRAYRPGVRLPIGEHLIEVARSGYTTALVREEVAYGDNVARVVLKRAYGRLVVTATPAGARITIGYRDADGRQKAVPYTEPVRLPVGPVDVRARLLGFRTGYRAVSLTEAGTSVALALEALDVRAGARLRDRLADGGLAPEVVVIAPGAFVMGDEAGSANERPTRRVLLTQPFAVSVREVSTAEYRRFAEATGRERNAKVADDTDELPARYVTWQDAVAYTDWLTAQTGAKYRLPTEAEWEYVARAGSTGPYPFGDAQDALCDHANLADLSAKAVYHGWEVVDCEDSFARLAPVGSFPANAFGLQDTLGNVSEWVAECGMPSYDGAPDDGSVADDGQGCRTHGYRGGSWDSQASQLRVSYRSASVGSADDRGIRLVREL
jgi:formylglycine-generating enzyme required for sulfatase activity